MNKKMNYFKIDPQNPEPAAIKQAVDVLKRGGVIVYPTDTLYGLGVDIFNRKALNKLYTLKERDFRLPISLMVHSINQIEELYADISPQVRKWLSAIMPGKITAILPSRIKTFSPLNDYFTTTDSGKQKVGFRIPDLPVCHELTEAFANPISSTSANLSGRANALTIPEVISYFGNKLDLILDAGKMCDKSGSTIIDFCKDPLLVVREGAITLNTLKKKLPERSIRKRRFKYRITFVCSGNICRSPMAEFILKAMFQKTKYRDFLETGSAGTLDLASSAAHELAIKVSAENDINLAVHRSKPVSEETVVDSDLIICMAVNHYEYLREHYPESRQKTILLKSWNREKPPANRSVADPIGHDYEFFRETFKEIRSEIKRILPFIFSDVRKFIEYNDLEMPK